MRLAIAIGVALISCVGVGCTSAASEAADGQRAEDADSGRAAAEVAQLIELARRALSEAEGDLATAPSGKGMRAELAAIRDDLAAAAALLSEAEAAQAAGRVDEVRTKAKSAISGADTVQRAIEQAREIQAFRARPGV